MRNLIISETPQLPNNTPDVYEIIIDGTLDEHWSDWLGGFCVTILENGNTLLAGEIPDQAALHGLLTRIHNLNLKLISVTRKNDQGLIPNQGEIK